MNDLSCLRQYTRSRPGGVGCIRRRCSCIRFSCISPRRLPLFSVSRWVSWFLGSVFVQFWCRFGYSAAKREPKGGLREPKGRHGVANGRRRKPTGDQEMPLSGQRGPKEGQREAKGGQRGAKGRPKGGQGRFSCHVRCCIDF